MNSNRMSYIIHHFFFILQPKLCSTVSSSSHPVPCRVTTSTFRHYHCASSLEVSTTAVSTSSYHISPLAHESRRVVLCHNMSHCSFSLEMKILLTLQLLHFLFTYLSTLCENVWKVLSGKIWINKQATETNDGCKRWWSCSWWKRLSQEVKRKMELMLEATRRGKCFDRTIWRIVIMTTVKVGLLRVTIVVDFFHELQSQH